MKSGLYEEVLNQILGRAVTGLAPNLVHTEALDDGESHDVLSEYLQHRISDALAGLKGQKRLEKQIALCNEIIRLLYASSGDHNDQTILSTGRRLLSVIEPEQAQASHPERPDTPLSHACLLTGTRLDPSLVSQLKKEILTASKIDILCSFIKWTGIRILQDELKAFTQKPGAQLRIITTSYLGATDLKAIDFLQSLQNTDLRVSYDTRRTRLHAKAYVFHRDTNFSTAYIGSSNLSQPALTDGLEWNVKISQYESPHLWEKVTAAFETYWNDGEFAPYSEKERPRLLNALESERGDHTPDRLIVNFDLNPYAFQQEILDQLEAERLVQERTWNLVVSATGTGKTIIAAFDYKRYCQNQTGERPRLLFIAHRKEILEQSIATFRAVLRDQNFGDLLVGHYEPEQLEHLFVSIQSYNSKKLSLQLPPDYYDYVVIDEFHHAAAKSYDRLLRYIQPKVLLGLTATPERADGINVLKYFGGHISAEIRLPDAVNRKLLCPFQYFGITDPVSLNDLTWQRGGYSSDELDKKYTGNDLRTTLVIEKVKEILLNVRQARGLGFCVSVAHAQYMAEQFSVVGIPAEALSAESDTYTRETVQSRLRKREINFIFTVDLYNEGVDIPEVDTVLFLRPTESLTVFLQQLGRGLRHYDRKDYLTVLDFIGNAHRNYRWDVRYRALVDDPSRSIADQVEQGFPHLPAGCSIQLERIAKQHILGNIRQNLQRTKTYLIQEIAELFSRLSRIPTLSEFLEFYRLSPDDIYRRKVSWSRLCVEAGVCAKFDDPDEERLTKGLRRIQHISSVSQIHYLMQLLDLGQTPTDLPIMDENEERMLLMAHFCLWGQMWKPDSIVESLTRLKANPTLYKELIELLSFRLSKVDAVPPAVELPFISPLELHAQYTRDEILAALGHWTLQSQPDMREGVLHLPDKKADLFLVTLNKTESDYSPTTMYEDYAISDNLFHWQSQSTTRAESPTGRRYIEHQKRGHTILLCVREHKTVNSLSAPYYFLGPADYKSHTGSRPINIIWKLRHPMPAKLLRKTARLAVM